MCRLTDFQLSNEQGEKQALESLDIGTFLYITGKPGGCVFIKASLSRRHYCALLVWGH